MVELKEDRLAREIYEKVGGTGNVSKVIHCMTRVRMDIRDESLVQMEDLKAIDGVMGVVEDDNLQVIVGPGTVNKVANKMVEMVGVKLGDPIPVDSNRSETAKGNSGLEEAERVAAATKAAQKKKNNTPVKRALKSIANIFVPMIPAFVGAGIIGGIAAIISNLLLAGNISGDNWVTIVTVLNIIKNGLFVYLQIYVGINAAKEFGATEALGGIVGGIVYLAGMTPEMPLPNIFTGGDLVAGQGGIIGVIFAVWLIAIVEKRLHKVIPEAIDIIITPTPSSKR